MLMLLTAAALPIARAQTLPPEAPLRSLTLRFDTRYDTIAWGDIESRLQNSALVSFSVAAPLGTELLGMASTGDDFTSRWSTSWDLNGEPPERMALSLRQLYLQRWFGAARVQAGSLPPVKGGVSTSGLEDLGWIDGVRGEVHAPSGLIVELVGGSLSELDEPDLFIRARRLDYAEAEATWSAPSGVEVEAAVHHLAPERYLKAELGWAPPSQPLTLRAEGGLNVAAGTTLAVLTGSADVLSGRLKATARLRWVDPEYGRFGELSEDFYQYGAECTLRLDGTLDDSGYLRWSARYIAPLQAALAPRLDVGLTAKLTLRRAEP